MKRACVLSPSSAQSHAIAMFLRRYCPEVDVVGVVLDGEWMLDWPDMYSLMIPLCRFEREDVDCVSIPTGSRSTRYLLERGDVTIGSVTLTRPALRVYDKPWMIARASQIGIRTPATWEKLTDVPDYPLFYKPRFERGSGPRGVAHTEADIPWDVRQDLVFQEVIHSQGTYGVGFLADKGHLIATHAHFESESVPRAGGSAVIIERFADRRLIDYTQQLTRSLGYSGWGLTEFKYDPYRDDFVFMEVNAKFWASCEFSFINEPLFLKLLFGIDSAEEPVQRMVFVDRALSRGPMFVLRHLGCLACGSKLRMYPGWLRRVIVGLVPSNVNALLRRHLIKTRNR